jgi:hypothetical protein
MKIIPLVHVSNEDVIPKNTMLDSLTLELLRLGDPLTPLDDNEDERKRCLEALERSARRTMSSLAFNSGCASFSGNMDGLLSNALECLPPGLTKDTWLAVSSLLASGLPMPKSPSGELPRLDWSVGVNLTSQLGRASGSQSGSAGTKGLDRKGEQGECKVMEREERGWWTLRFQQVWGEMKRRSDVCTSEL